MVEQVGNVSRIQTHEETQSLKIRVIALRGPSSPQHCGSFVCVWFCFTQMILSEVVVTW